MSKRKEKISAFLDNDMRRDELMSFSLSSETSDAKIAQRYQMMGETLRGEMGEASFIDVSRVVRETLQDENISVADQTASSVQPSSEKTGLFNLSSWFKPVAGMAVAASVAMIMVVSVNEQGGNLDISPVVANVDSQFDLQPKAQPEAQSVAQLVLVAEDKVVDSKAANLEPYINQHLEFASQDTLQGRLPYVRAVSFTPGNKQSRNQQPGNQ